MLLLKQRKTPTANRMFSVSASLMGTEQSACSLYRIIADICYIKCSSMLQYFVFSLTFNLRYFCVRNRQTDEFSYHR